MRALAILVACCLGAAPASAFGHFGGPPPHAGGHGHGGHGRGGLGYLDGALGPAYLPPLPGPDQAIAAPYVVPYAAPAASQCLPAAPARPHLPPHIIYIGHAPEIVGPKVIYGTN